MTAIMSLILFAIFGAWAMMLIVIAWASAACADEDAHVDRDALGDYPHFKRKQ